MAQMDSYNNINPVLIASPGSFIASITPANGVDMEYYESMTFVLSSGTITAGTWTPLLEESDSIAAGFTTVIAPFLIGTINALTGPVSDDSIFKYGYVGKKRFVRLSLILSGGPGNAEFCLVAQQGNPRVAPVNLIP